jgi:hypothetical protein
MRRPKWVEDVVAEAEAGRLTRSWYRLLYLETAAAGNIMRWTSALQMMIVMFLVSAPQDELIPGPLLALNPEAIVRKMNPGQVS